MAKPRIFIYMHYLELGGAETALIGLLNALDPERVEVDLLLGDIRGPLVSKVPKHVRILPPMIDYSMIERPLVHAIFRGLWSLAWRRLYAKWEFHKYCRTNRPIDNSAIYGYIGRYVTPILSSLHLFGHYDLAVSFLHPHNIVLEKVDAAKRVCWIHTDYSKIDVNAALELPTWRAYDHIVAVSDQVGEQFANKFPTLANRIVTIENMLSAPAIRQQAQLGYPPSDMPIKPNGINLLTIGRYSPAKRLDVIPTLTRLLRQRGLDINWTIIGYGGSDKQIRDAISDNGMADHVRLLGRRTNPYPYIAHCDWYVQPSLFEGKSIVVREAQILCKPVIITDYPTAKSQIAHGIDGIIVPMDVQACASAMYDALTDSAMTCNIIDYLKKHDFGMIDQVEKFYEFVE